MFSGGTEVGFKQIYGPDSSPIDSTCIAQLHQDPNMAASVQNYFTKVGVSSTNSIYTSVGTAIGDLMGAGFIPNYPDITLEGYASFPPNTS